MRKKYSSGNVLIMSIKDQNVPGKLCLSGAVDENLTSAITQVLKSDSKNVSAVMEKDKYDLMWETVWRETRLTTGHTAFSFEKSYFPRGKIIVKLLDTIAGFGWGLTACPNMGGVESRDDKGNVTSTVDWPVFIFYKEAQSEFTNEHLLLAVKDSNIPGKLCAAGPVGDLEARMAQALQKIKTGVESKKDDYDGDFDVVWRNTSITSGHQTFSFAKSYFPLGKTNVTILETAYAAGWRAVAAPNFGGWGDSWPSYVFRKLKSPSTPPALLFASIKDSNLPGKLCISGSSADGVTDAMCGALTKIEGNSDVKSEKDEYDQDHDCVARNVHITTGIQMFSFRCKYYPRGDSMKTVLNTWQGEGFQVVACPNFGGMTDSWPTFVLEKRASVPAQMFLAIKDDNIPGKVALAWRCWFGCQSCE
jgi:methionine-rich copper-binding protein CopC